MHGRWEVSGGRWAKRVALLAGLGLHAPRGALAAPEAPHPRSAEVREAVASGPRKLLAPAGPEQQALGVELGRDGLWYRVCAARDCDARAGKRLELPALALEAAERGTLEIIEPFPARRLVHARIPLAEGAWEALIGAGMGSSEAVVIFAGSTGLLEGEDGQKSGAMLWLREDEKGQRVLVGRAREDVQLCGRPTLLEPRLLDRDLSLKPARVQQLTLEERRGARVLGAKRAEQGPTAGGNALRAVVASSALSDPRGLTDGRAETSWSEARGGEGRGEFVVLRQIAGGKLIALEFLVRPAGDVAEAGAAPRSLWLATRHGLYRVDWQEDAWQAPGVWFRVQLPEPLEEDCLALVLEQAYVDAPEAQVTLAELRGVSEFQLLEPAQLVARLSAPGEAGAAAVPALLQSGSPGVEALVGAFGALDSIGRARALDVLEAAPCEVTAKVYVDLLDDDAERNRRRAAQRLRSCGSAGAAHLRRAFELVSGEAGVRLAKEIAVISPALAVELLGPRLAVAAPEQRAGYRDALGRAARDPEAEAGLRRLLGGSGLGVAAEVEVLRAIGDRLPRFQPQASLTLARAIAAARSFPQRFLLLAPASRLAPTDVAAAEFSRAALADPDPYLRAAGARLAPDLPSLRAPLLAATRDSGVRVREASVARLGELSVPGAAPALVARLDEDAWPLVRTVAARSLASVGPSVEVDAALAVTLRDEAPGVRVAGLRALGQRGARAHVPAIVARFRDEAEAPEVRAAAIRALAALCDTSQLEELTRAAWKLVAERPSPPDVALGGAALAALGRLHPPDLDRRLAPLDRDDTHPNLKQMLTAARHFPERCAASRPSH